jgi:hypothetical protein
MTLLPLGGRVAENNPKSGRFWTPVGRYAFQLDAGEGASSVPGLSAWTERLQVRFAWLTAAVYASSAAAHHSYRSVVELL